MIIIPTWDRYLGNKISRLDIKAPYQSPMEVDTDFEASGVNSDKLGAFSQLQIGQDAAATYISGTDPLWRFWIGGAIPTDANVRIDKYGNIYAGSIILVGYIPTGGAATDINDHSDQVDPAKLDDGAIGSTISVGNTTGGFVKVDGTNKRFLTNDGTNNRGVFGNV